jgi:hypothetical protein
LILKGDALMQMRAITQIPAPSDEFKGKIVDVLEKDTIGDKIIRFLF